MTEAFKILNKWLCPPSENARFWSYTTGVHLGLLLQEAGYEEQSQYASLLFLRHCVVDGLGPRPTSCGAPQVWKSFMTDDVSPIEYSWSWDTQTGPPKIRFSVEAISPEAGTEADTFNQKMSTELDHHLNSIVPDVDWTLFDHFRGEFCSKNSKGRSESRIQDLEQSHTSSIFLAFEMDKRDVAVRAYLFLSKLSRWG